MTHNINFQSLRHLGLLSILTLSFFISSAQHSPQTDREALKKLYEACDGDNWDARLDIPWDTTGVMSSWFGVTLDPVSGRVVELDLSFRLLDGSLPDEMGNLDSLKYLNLSGNTISSSIPATIGSLTAIEKIELQRNLLEDEIPSSITNLIALASLNINDNLLSGSLPENLGNMTSLVELDISDNRLVGAIPVSIGNLTNLETLELDDNILSGILPGSIGGLVNLYELNLSRNQIGGVIPSGIGELVNLTDLSLEINHFSGDIPSEIQNLTNIETLDLSANDLTGISEGVFNMSWLTKLNLGFNNISGVIPSGIGAMDGLLELDLSNNEFNGSIPEALGAFSKITSLKLGNNELTGTIPDTICSLQTLEILYLRNNLLSGSIPDAIGNLSHIKDLMLNGNQLEGKIPHALYDLKTIEILDLSENLLTGHIEGGLSRLDNLDDFNVSYNLLDSLPPYNTSTNYPASLIKYQCHENKLTFEDLEQSNRIQSELGRDFKYAQQKKFGEPQSFTATYSKTFEISSIPGGTQSKMLFKWYKDGVAIDADYSTTPELSIPFVLEKDAGVYHVEVISTNIWVEDLVLVSEPITVDVFVPCMAKDSLTLVEFYNKTSGATQWINDTNWNRVDIIDEEEVRFPVSTWFGIKLAYDEKDGCDHVVSVDLDSNNIFINLPDTLAGLTHLEKLSLSYNTIKDDLPESYSRLDSLKYLNLSNNSIVDAIPDVYYNLNSLEYLSLGSNNINDVLKPALGGLSNLKYLDLSDNSFSGTIPTELTNLTNLEHLFLQDNYDIEGEIPTTINQLTKLQSLDLSNNQMTGDLPDELYTLSELKLLKLADNGFSESELRGFGDFTNLEILWLSENNFTGSILNQIMPNTKLKSLRIDNNNFRGSIPLNIGDLTMMEELWLQENNLLNEVRSSIGNMSDLRELRLNDNDFTGNLNGIWNCTKLEVLDVRNNRISGEIPLEFNNLDSLKSASFTNNLFTGLTDVDDDPVLELLEVEENILTFEDLEYNKDKMNVMNPTTNPADSTFTYIPQKKFGEEKTVTVGEGQRYSLSIPCGGTANHYWWFKDDLPLNTENALKDTSVLVFDPVTKSDSGYYHLWVQNDIIDDLTLLSNKVRLIVEESCIADDSLALVALYENCGGENWTNNTNWLVGPINTWYGITSEPCDVTHIDLSNNNLVDTLPDAFFYLVGLVDFDLSGNQLAGNLSSSVSQMIVLEDMNLASNQMDGNLPATMYDMSTLKSINISNNDFNGIIDSRIGNLNQLVTVNLGYNHFSGTIPEEVGNLSSLKNLFLNDNQIEGEMNPLIGLMTSLERINIEGNKFYGTVPATINNLVNLRMFNIAKNKFEGEIASLNTLTKLNELRVDSNRFYSIPSLDGLDSLKDVSTENNALSFEDFERSLRTVEAADKSTEITFTYHPQDSVLNDTTIIIEEGFPIDLDRATPGKYNQYAWYKDGQLIDGYPGDATYHFDAVRMSDEGAYHVTVKNDSVPGLELYSRKIYLEPYIPCMRRDSMALVALYHATNGDNWIRNDEWLVGPVQTWYGITGDECDVWGIDLDNNNLDGYIPEEMDSMVMLQLVDFSSNNIKEYLPEGLSGWTSLKSFEIDSNKIEDWLPDFSNAADLTTLKVEHNKFLFGDLASSGLDPGDLDFTYDPQDTILALGYDKEMKAIWIVADEHLDHNDNQYEWYQDFIRKEGVTGTEINITENGQYYAMVKNGDEFADLIIYTDTINITDLKPEYVEVDPINTIIVDGGHSTLFVVDDIENYPDNSLVVLTRWGNKVYETTGYTNNFDMKDYPAGTYYFVLNVKAEKDEKTIKSFIQLVKK